MFSPPPKKIPLPSMRKCGLPQKISLVTMCSDDHGVSQSGLCPWRSPHSALETVNPERSAAICLMYLTRLNTYCWSGRRGGDCRARKGGPGVQRPPVSSEFMTREDPWSLSPRGRCTGCTHPSPVSLCVATTSRWRTLKRSAIKTFTTMRSARTGPGDALL